MAIRNDNLPGGIDFITDESLYPEDMNDTFNVFSTLENSFNVHRVAIASNSTASGSYTTLQTINLTSGGLNITTQGVFFHFIVLHSGGTDLINLKFTDVNDDVVNVIPTETYTSGYNLIIYGYRSETKIKTIEIQAKTAEIMPPFLDTYYHYTSCYDSYVQMIYYGTY